MGNSTYISTGIGRGHLFKFQTYIQRERERDLLGVACSILTLQVGVGINNTVQ
jgi:hypothetical protein